MNTNETDGTSVFVGIIQSNGGPHQPDEKNHDLRIDAANLEMASGNYNRAAGHSINLMDK